MSNWHVQRVDFKGDYTDTFPLWIHPWVSGIYALENQARAPDGEKIPALLTSYIDELGDATLMMHVTDYRHIEGGEIEWSHWTAVRWRKDKFVSLYGRIEEGWRLSRVMDLPLSDNEFIQLSQNCQNDVNAAIFLLPYLPLATQLSIWDGKEPLFCCEDYLDQFRGEPFIADVLNLETIPLQQTRRWPKEWDEPTQKDISPLSAIADWPTRAFIREALAEVEQSKTRSSKTTKEPKKTRKKTKRRVKRS